MGYDTTLRAARPDWLCCTAFVLRDNGFGLDHALPGPSQPLPEIANLLNGNVLFGLIIGVNGLELPLCAPQQFAGAREG